MNRLVLATAGLALMIIFALGIYFYRSPPPSAPLETPAPAKTILNLLQAPREVPDIRFNDEEGRSLKLSDFRGKIVLLNIWATWCPPCRAEMPTLDRLQARLGGPAFEVVALSIDRGGTFVVRMFYDEIGIKSLRVYIDQSAQASPALGATGVPTTLLIDPSGREIARKIGPAEWDSPEIVALIQRLREQPAVAESGKR